MKLNQLAIACTFALASSAFAQEPKTPRKPLVVHEWGTFTSFSGSNGLHLEFRPFSNEAPDLPQFVADRHNFNGNWLVKKGLRGRIRMETPVTYFYTDDEQIVRASVDFPSGLLTEFYPPVQSMEPKYTPELANGKGEPVGNGKLDWGSLRLIPSKLFEPSIQSETDRATLGTQFIRSMLPDAGQFPHYHHARNTDSAIVQWDPRNLAAGLDAETFFGGAKHYEKFLFYRGVGNFELPTSIKFNAEGRVEFSNQGTEVVRSIFLVEVDRGVISLATLDAVGPNETKSLGPTSAISLDALGEKVTQALEAEGLFAKEAQAMFECWKTSWFAEDGLRVFSMVPQSITDRLLPLHIDPVPSEMIRVLVARCELMSPAMEQRVLKEVEASIVQRRNGLALAARNANYWKEEDYFPVSIQQLGRMAEPMLLRAAELSNDPKIDEEIEKLLAKIHRNDFAATR